jgi:predicted  nucleic acid-binding Zn-ribbon protein
VSANFVIRLDVHVHHHQDNETELSKSIASLRSLIMTTRDEFVSQLNDLKTQLDDANAKLAKGQGEVVTAVAANTAAVAALNQKIAELQAIIDAGGSDIPPDVVSKFTEVKASADATTAAAQALDDLNPDA